MRVECEPPNHPGDRPTIGVGGRYVTFTTDADNLIAYETNTSEKENGMKVSEKVVERAGQSIDPDESIDEMVFVMQGPRLALYFGALGAAFTKNFWVVATDDHIYVMKPQGKSPMTVAAKHPRAETAVAAKKGFPVGAIEIGAEKFWLPMGQQKKALALAGSGGST